MDSTTLKFIIVAILLSGTALLWGIKVGIDAIDKQL